MEREQAGEDQPWLEVSLVNKTVWGEESYREILVGFNCEDSEYRYEVARKLISRSQI